ncbi:P-loop containing nucleoside triphosphate hydrolase [Abortiporus biennis]
MRTVKLVVIGASGVGKTSLRHQYISGRFTTGYRATIGADFITKTLPHPSNPDENIVLQIWDTAGQERFSSLSSAFFRGADAVLMMFDVNQPQTLDALKKWWEEFKDKAPIPDEETSKFCCVAVGNKMDITPSNPESRISQSTAQHFLDEMIPSGSSSFPPTPEINYIPETTVDDTDVPPLPLNGISNHYHSPEPSIGIDIYHHNHFHKRGRKSVSRSQSRSTVFRGGTMGTMTTTHTIYHTPTSSIFDNFESARTSPIPRSSSSAYSDRDSRSPSHSPIRSPRRMASMSSTSSVPTITPSLFIRGQGEVITLPTTACTTPSPFNALPPRPDQGPKLFLTSAKTGEGVADVFEYIAERVIGRWEYEEAIEARTLHMRESSSGTIRLDHQQNSGRKWFGNSRSSSSCCRT